jgi:hypothetical protein
MAQAKLEKSFPRVAEVVDGARQVYDGVSAVAGGVENAQQAIAGAQEAIAGAQQVVDGVKGEQQESEFLETSSFEKLKRCVLRHLPCKFVLVLACPDQMTPAGSAAKRRSGTTSLSLRSCPRCRGPSTRLTSAARRRASCRSCASSCVATSYVCTASETRTPNPALGLVGSHRLP